MRRPASRTWLLIALMAVLGPLAGCTDPVWYGATPEVRSFELHEGWEYRYGDSPFTDDGVPLWTIDADDQAWKPQDFPNRAPVKGDGDHNLWQRVRLPKTLTKDQVLFLRGVWQIIEVYWQGRRIHAYGRFDADGKGYFPGRAWQFVPLDPSMGGDYLYFRSYSDDKFVGVYEGAYIGTRHDHLLMMLKMDLPLFAMGAVYAFMGFVTIFTYSRNREPSNLSFGLFSTSIGIYEVCRCYTKQLLFHDPFMWDNLELLALYSVPYTFSMFVEHLFGPGPARLVSWVKRVSLAYIAVSFALMVLLGKPLWFVLYPFQYYMICAAIVLVVVVGWVAYEGNKEARTFFFGIVMVTLGAIHDILRSMGVIQGVGIMNHLGVFVLVVSLALIVGRRLLNAVLIKKNLELASAVQQLLLPRERDGRFATFDYSSCYEPYGRMAGDWLNFWEVSPKELRLFFGDVMGNGPQAALAVAAIAAFLEESKKAGDDVETSIRRVNDGLRKLFGGHITTTLTALVLHADGRVEAYNCGGLGWIHLGERARHVAIPSSILGLSADPKIGRRELTLAPGELLFAFSDGVLEGARAVTRLARELENYDSKEIPFDVLFEIAKGITAKREVHDDRSIVAVRRVADAARLAG